MASIVPPCPPASFRDPGGRVVRHDGRLLRLVNASGGALVRSALESRRVREFMAAGSVVRSFELTSSECERLAGDGSLSALGRSLAISGIVEHEAVPFPSYPYEWSAEMLQAAGALTIDLAASVLDDGLGLKDATPYNVLFRGPEPVFIDLLSFERRDPHDPQWLPYGQFIRTFILPLLLARRGAWTVQELLLSRRDGIDVEDAYGGLSWLERLSPRYFARITAPAWLSKRHDPDDASLYRERRMNDPDRARFVLGMLFRGLRKALAAAAPGGACSTWSAYAEAGGNNYSSQRREKKDEFVRDFLREFRPKRVLDVGCNTGRFSAMAVEQGSSVVAIDSDPVVSGLTWRMARERALDILPLAVDLARPTPATGWRNEECRSFLDRARGFFDATLWLAVIHHMLVTERIPLDELVRMAAELTGEYAVMEFVGPDDSMFRRLVRGREELYRQISREGFEAACRERFDIVRSAELSGTDRCLYVLHKRV